VAEESCSAITQAAGRSCCGRSGYNSTLEFRLQLDFLVPYIHMQLIICILNSDSRKISFSPDLPERNYCEGVSALTFGWCSDRFQASDRSKRVPQGFPGAFHGTPYKRPRQFFQYLSRLLIHNLLTISHSTIHKFSRLYSIVNQRQEQ
jgi:hypothetical protein